MGRFVIVADSASDITPEIAERYGIEVVKMHVTIGDETIDDGDMSSEEMFRRCEELDVMPRTSGSNPGDFGAAFDRIHEEQPDAQIIYAAYSAVTTVSYESALIAAEGRDYVHAIDTKQVSAGILAVLVGTARYLDGHPEASVDDVLACVADLSGRTHMSFIPGDLGYLRAGGRLSNAAFLGARVLNIKPVIEIIDGRLVATKKLRGSMRRAIIKLLDQMTDDGAAPLETDHVFLLRGAGFPERVQMAVTDHLHEQGFGEIEWIDTGNVISSHSGPGSFGAVFVDEQA